MAAHFKRRHHFEDKRPEDPKRGKAREYLHYSLATADGTCGNVVEQVPPEHVSTNSLPHQSTARFGSIANAAVNVTNIQIAPDAQNPGPRMEAVVFSQAQVDPGQVTCLYGAVSYIVLYCSLRKY